jgi:peroxiredoxin-like protein
MSSGYDYKSTARWAADRRGLVNGEDIEQSIDFSAPPEFHGEPGLWTPEHFLVSAVATCFVTTFLAIAELSKLEPRSLEVAAEGTVEKAEGHFQFTRIIVRPVLAIDHESDRERAYRILEKAEHSCLVSRSLQSKVVMEPTVTVLGQARALAA